MCFGKNIYPWTSHSLLCKVTSNIFSIEEIEDIMADTQEAVEKQREIESLLSGQLSQVITFLLLLVSVYVRKLELF